MGHQFSFPSTVPVRSSCPGNGQGPRHRLPRDLHPPYPPIRIIAQDDAIGAVTLIQRFGSALNLSLHLHILFLDGVYVYRDNRSPRFQRVKAPVKDELENLVKLISQRVCDHSFGMPIKKSPNERFQQ